MAGTLNLDRFKFDGEQLRAVSELIFDEYIKTPELAMLHTIYPNIVTNKVLGFITGGALAGVKNQGCDPKAQGWDVGTRSVEFTPETWEVLISMCFEDLESTAAVYSLRKGTDMADFTDTDYQAIILDVLGRSMREFVYRLWFNDKSAKNFSAGGFITNNTDVAYFNLLDGFFKQMEIQATANPKQLTVIAENAGATYKDQALDPNKIQGYLSDMYFNADIRLRGLSNNIIACTRSVYDAYLKSLVGVQLETMYANLTNGMQTLTFQGVPLVPIDIWDVIITSYQNDGTRLYNPHRAIYTSPDVLALGFDDPNAVDDIRTWYNQDERRVKMETMGKIDQKLANPEFFQIAI